MATHSFSATLALLVLSLLIFLVEVRATTQCYFPDGTKSGDTPCYTDGRVSACCGDDAICLTNGLCLSLAQPYRLSRGSCTDYAWGSSCPQYCTTAQPSAGASVVWLTNGTTGGSTGDETEYCCNSVIISVNDTLVCSKIHGTTQDPFTLNSTGHVIVGVAGLEGLVETSDANSSTITNSTGNTCTTAGSNSDDSSKEIAIGTGVGVPLGVIALLSIGWALYERRKRLNTQETTYIHPSIATEERPYSELNSIQGPVPVELSSSPLSDLASS